MAPVGQLSMQARHSTHALASMTAMPSSLTLMASAGQPASQEPQPTHVSAFTTGTAIFLLLKQLRINVYAPRRDARRYVAYFVASKKRKPPQSALSTWHLAFGIWHAAYMALRREVVGEAMMWAHHDSRWRSARYVVLASR